MEFYRRRRINSIREFLCIKTRTLQDIGLILTSECYRLWHLSDPINARLKEFYCVYVCIYIYPLGCAFLDM